MGLGSRVSYVAADDRDGAREMVRHLLATGRRRIGMISGPPDLPGGTDRLTGYREALAEAAAAYDPALVAAGDYRRSGGEAAARLLLARAPDLDAVFVASDIMVQGVIQVLHEHGRSVPGDIAVGGFDDSPAAGAVSPALTTVRQPFERISAEMVRMLLAQIAGEPTAGVILPTELVVRAST
jgi:DNA-binding LacI/PurR family transcriptional regulator